MAGGAEGPAGGRSAIYREHVIGALAWLLVLVVALAALAVLLARAATPALPTGKRGVRLPGRQRVAFARSLEAARWAAAHDEQDGVTRVLLRRSCTGPDGWPLILEERVFATIPASDPEWEPRFTEAMAQARFRCDYLNTEEAAG
jgi:hypothetical protein